MSNGVGVAGIYVHDQEEALAFYVDKLGFKVHTDVRNGDFRWLTVQHPDQPDFQLGLYTPGPPVIDEATASAVAAIVAKGAMPPLVLAVDDCRAACERLRAKGVELTQEPVDRFGTVQALLRGDNAAEHTIEAAKQKAYTAAAFGTPTSELAKRINGNGPSIADLPGTLFLAGGVPLKVNGVSVAGIGVGGAPDGALDEACATAGADAIIAAAAQ